MFSVGIFYSRHMKAKENIKKKQQAWALRKGYDLVSGTINGNGEKSYLKNIADNLFEPLADDVATAYSGGDGGELKDNKTRLAKMKATHSSSAIVVNLFQYWVGKDASPLLYALSLISKPKSDFLIKNIGSTSPKVVEIPPKQYVVNFNFEKQYKIHDDHKRFPRPANLDVCFEYSLCNIAIESKFTEPYSGRHKSLRDVYLEEESLWTKLPNLYELAKNISQNKEKFHYLDVPQLIKHILGLNVEFPRKRNRLITDYKLLYLWYDAFGEEGAGHRAEIERFAAIAKSDGVMFRHTTYQEVITKLFAEYRDGNEEYIDYLSERYL